MAAPVGWRQPARRKCPYARRALLPAPRPLDLQAQGLSLFQVIARYDVWRRVQAHDGTVGWMNVAMLTDRRTALVTGRDRVPVYADPEPRAKIVAYAMPGATANLEACAIRSCRICRARVEGLDRQKPHLGRRRQRSLQIGVRGHFA